MTPFKLFESELWSGSREIAIQGDLDLAVCGKLEAAIRRAVEREHDVLVDLLACEFIDASAFEVLLRGAQELRARGHELMLHGVRNQVQRVLSLSGQRSLTVASGAVGRQQGTLPQREALQGATLTHAA